MYSISYIIDKVCWRTFSKFAEIYCNIISLSKNYEFDPFYRFGIIYSSVAETIWSHFKNLLLLGTTRKWNEMILSCFLKDRLLCFCFFCFVYFFLWSEKRFCDLVCISLFLSFCWRAPFFFFPVKVNSRKLFWLNFSLAVENKKRSTDFIASEFNML